jgi:hypothetical protein
MRAERQGQGVGDSVTVPRSVRSGELFAFRLSANSSKCAGEGG